MNHFIEVSEALSQALGIWSWNLWKIEKVFHSMPIANVQFVTAYSSAAGNTWSKLRIICDVLKDTLVDNTRFL